MPQISALFIIVIMLGGCDDIYTKEEVAPVSIAAAVNSGVHLGVLVDGAVSNVRYTTSPSNVSGFTDKQGSFFYYPNDTIKFTIGDVLLGHSSINVKAQSMITPLTLVDATYITSNAPTNIARFIQTLDSDSNTSNGITIADATHTLAEGKDVDFGQLTTLFGTNSDKTDTMTVLNGKTILDANTSQTHLENTINVKFTSDMLGGKTFTALWKLGGEYSTYVFNTSVEGSVDIYEESREIAKKSKLQASWSVDSSTGLVTISGITDSSDSSTKFADRTLDLLAIINTDTYLVKNSDVHKDFGVMRTAAQSFTESEFNTSTFTLLGPLGDYGIFDFNQTGTNVLAVFPEDSNATLTWTLTSGKVKTNGTVAGVERNDTIEPLVNRGEIYKIKHTLDKNGTTIHTNQYVSFVGDTIPLFNTMATGAYYCVTNKGLFYRLVLNSNGTGSISYQKDIKTGVEDYSATAAGLWTINASYQLQLNNIYNGSTETKIKILKSLQALNEGMYLMKNVEPFSVGGPQEYTIMYKSQPKKSVTDIAGTYKMIWEEYNATSAQITQYSDEKDRYKIHFDSNQTGYYLNDSDKKQYHFNWSLDTLGRIELKDREGYSNALMTFMYDYRGTIKVSERYQSDPDGVYVYQRFYTFTKQ